MLGLMLYVLKLFPHHPTNRVWYIGFSGSWVRILLPLISICFFFQIEETCTFMNISSLKYHLSVIQNQKTVLPCVNIVRGERGYGRWDLMLTMSSTALEMNKANGGRRKYICRYGQIQSYFSEANYEINKLLK